MPIPIPDFYRRVRLIDKHKNTHTFFSLLPVEIIFEISRFADAEKFSEALKHVAYGELEQVKDLLDKNPTLVLYTGTVTTRSGLIVEEATLLECALGAGDPEIAKMIMPYFSKITYEQGNSIADAGEKEKLRQLERYRPHIEGMLNQEPYDFNPLIKIIKESSQLDVIEALNKNVNHESELWKALKQFRDEVRPGKLKKPGMHYNYQTLIHAFEILAKEWNNLSKSGTLDKCDLVWRQVVGYLQRGLPAVDRMAFAQGVNSLVNNEAVLKREIKCAYGNNLFPNTSSADAEFSGLGFDHAIYEMPLNMGYMGYMRWNTIALFKTYVEQKLQTCRTIYLATPTNANIPGCDL